MITGETLDSIMLKWLKQRPPVIDTGQVQVTQHSFDHHIDDDVGRTWVQESQPGPQNVQASISMVAGVEIRNDAPVSGQNVTDDPLAVFQMQINAAKSESPVRKLKLFKSPKSNRKSGTGAGENEIYAVSRVNPLFQDDTSSVFANKSSDTNEILGNRSGSSGYDSNSPSDDNGDDSDSNKVPATLVTATTILQGTPLKLFSEDKDDLVIQIPQQQVDGRRALNESESLNRFPIVNKGTHILGQNLHFVKSIAFTHDFGNNAPETIGRALVRPPAKGTARRDQSNFTLEEKSAFPPSKKRVSAIPVPVRNSGRTDSVGRARITQKNTNYVQSIRICPNPSFSKGFRKSSTSANPQRKTSSSGQPSHQVARRKPSVTFSEQVDVLVENGKSNKKKISREEDSIVTESLINLTNSKSAPAMISNSNEDIVDYGENNSADVEAEADFVYEHVVHKTIENEKEVEDTGDSRNTNVSATSSSTSSSNNTLITNGGRSRSRVGQQKSPFGGIADHYAAAKEIAKEIESYSAGTTKSRKISFVRDLLLSNHNRRGHSSKIKTVPSVYTTSSYLVTPHNSVNPTHQKSTAGILNSGYETDLHEDDVRKGQSYPIIKIIDGKIAVIENRPLPQHHQHGSSSGGGGGNNHSSTSSKTDDKVKKSPSWKVLRVQPQLTQQQQVYVKANIHLLNTSSSSSVTTQAEESNSSTGSGGGGGSVAGDEGQDQVPIYEDLPRNSTIRRKSDDSDSGNSTDRNPNPVTNEISEEICTIHNASGCCGVSKKKDVPKSDSSSSSSSSGNNYVSSSSSVISTSEKSGSTTSSNCDTSSNKSKVMIVSGDSQNMVVDLTAVPTELREAIISGSVLMAVPASMNAEKQHQEPGYTMIAIPPEIRDHLISEDYDEDQLRKKYGTQNLTQMWNMLQYDGYSDSDGKKKSKNITTVLPFHPNHDTYTTPDFTLEGHRLAYQNKKVKNSKRRRCLCRLCGILVFLISFLGVIVTLSLIYTNGRKFFGSA